MLIFGTLQCILCILYTQQEYLVMPVNDMKEDNGLCQVDNFFLTLAWI